MPPKKFITENGILKFNPEYQKFKAAQEGKSFHAPKKIVKTKVTLTIIKARDLIAKDRNLMGVRTTSDPYVQVWANDQQKGQTKTIPKTLAPTYNESFEMKFFPSKIYGDNVNHTISLKIFDHDKHSKDDAMGTIILFVPKNSCDITKWHPVPKYSAKNAKGEVEVRIVTNVTMG